MFDDDTSSYRRRRHRVRLVPLARGFWDLLQISAGIVPIFSRPQKTLHDDGGAADAVSRPTAGCLVSRKVRKCVLLNGEARRANG